MGAFFTYNLGPLDLARTLGPHQRLLLGTQMGPPGVGTLDLHILHLAPNVCTTYKQGYYICVTDRIFGPQ